jgi:hypothetical protein
LLVQVALFMTELIKNRLNRDGTADLLKGLAVVFMIQVHLMEQFATTDTFESIIGKISLFLGGPPCAPVFLAVMGYFLASSSKPFSYFIKRGTILFFGGIILNIVRASNLLIRIFNHDVILDPWVFILGVDIFTLAGLSLILIGLLRQVFKANGIFYFLTALIVVFMAQFLPQAGDKTFNLVYAVGFLWGTSAWAYFPLFPWFAYVLTGYAFHLILRKFPQVVKTDFRHNYIFFIPLWATVIISLPWAGGISYNLYGFNGYYHHGILFFGWVILFMISYLIIVKLFDNFYGSSNMAKWLKWIGQKVTILYVIQWIIIGNLAPLFFGSQNIFQLTGWFFIVTVVTVLFGILYGRLRLLSARK